jgi:AraC-like DNA-binding protein
MELFGQSSTEMILFFILYGVSGVVPLMAAFYLLLRRGNAIAPGIKPPVRLRRWTASFFAVATLGHVWWLLFYIYSGDLQSVAYLVIVMLDCVLMFTTFAGTLLAMLQDRRRSVRPALMAMILFVVLWGAYIAYPSKLIEQIVSVYLLLLGLAFTGYMVVSIRQYGRWLNDNYADLENKKVWLFQAVALGSMLLFVLYALATDIVFIWLLHIIALVLVGLLLWRVETLPQLESTSTEASRTASDPELATQETESSNPSPLISNIDLVQIEQLLKEHCVGTQLYLKHDLTVQQLAQAIGTNRFYLSQYFSRQGITYNTYINNLRIDHFFARYEELAAAGQPIVAQQLARESGYRSYSTFGLAFKQRTDQTVTTWMRQAEQ